MAFIYIRPVILFYFQSYDFMKLYRKFRISVSCLNASLSVFSNFIQRNNKTFSFEDGRIIPKGINLILVGYQAHRNPDFFEDPNTFNPNRFATAETKHWNFAYIPFSAGPRNCIGKNFFRVLQVRNVSLNRYFQVKSSQCWKSNR